jgi:hypothetical protein
VLDNISQCFNKSFNGQRYSKQTDIMKILEKTLF